jgi:hypothetical protein
LIIDIIFSLQDILRKDARKIKSFEKANPRICEKIGMTEVGISLNPPGIISKSATRLPSPSRSFSRLGLAPPGPKANAPDVSKPHLAGRAF